ncbi:MAG: flagellar motor protein MotB [Bryobacteraceae bacterium]
MARKKKQPSHDNSERWLLSYADFITLLFAFFVVMFASSQADKGKAQAVSDAVKKALEGGKVTAIMASILGGTPGTLGKGNAMIHGPGGVRSKPTSAENPKYMVELMPSLLFLTTELHEEIESGKVQLNMEARGLVISLKETAFFPSGQDTIAQAGYGSIEKIAAQIKKVTNPVRLEGHTDSVPIHNSHFRSNWELSVARGIAMLTLMTQRFEVAEKQLSVAGYADNMPVSPNETEEGRARNRRVDVVILSNAGKGLEPGNEKTPPAPSPAASPAPGNPLPAPAAAKDHVAAAPAPAIAAKPVSAPPAVAAAKPAGRPAGIQLVAAPGGRPSPFGQAGKPGR